MNNTENRKNNKTISMGRGSATDALPLPLGSTRGGRKHFDDCYMSSCHKKNVMTTFVVVVAFLALDFH